MIAQIVQGVRNRLSRRRASASTITVPMWMRARMTSLGILARNGGPGSDLAAAELRGITTTIMVLGR